VQKGKTRLLVTCGIAGDDDVARDILDAPGHALYAQAAVTCSTHLGAWRSSGGGALPSCPACISERRRRG